MREIVMDNFVVLGGTQQGDIHFSIHEFEGDGGGIPQRVVLCQGIKGIIYKQVVRRKIYAKELWFRCLTLETYRR